MTDHSALIARLNDLADSFDADLGFSDVTIALLREAAAALARPTPAPEMAQSVFSVPHYGRTAPLDYYLAESGAGE